jgi:hypothetical protein
MINNPSVQIQYDPKRDPNFQEKMQNIIAITNVTEKSARDYLVFFHGNEE